MRSEKNIFIVFILNLTFCIAECIGGFFIGSTAIIADSLHDFGDALSIGVSCVLEKISQKNKNERYSFGYGRFSVLGSTITNLVLVIGSVLVVVSATIKLFNPPNVRDNEMIIFAIIGVAINSISMFVTHRGETLNEKSVYLHMLEDMLGWIAVLLGGILIKFTGFMIIDPIISIGVAVYIFIHSFKHLKKGMAIFLNKVPDNYILPDIAGELLSVEGVRKVNDIYLWSTDENIVSAIVNVNTDKNINEIKSKIRILLNEKGVNFINIETEIDSDL